MSVVGIGLTAACSLVLPSDELQCASNDDCGARGPAFAGSVCINSVCQTEPKWGCLANVKPPPERDPSIKVTYSIPLMDFLSYAPLAGIEARGCAQAQVDCTSPLFGPTVSGTDGTVSLQMDYGFDGYVELKDPNATGVGGGGGSGGAGALSGYATALLAMNPPPSGDAVSPPVPMLPLGIIGQLLEQAPEHIPGQGHVLVQVRDCQDNSAAGISFTATGAEKATVFYIRGQGSTTDVKDTDASGIGGLLYVNTGTVVVTGKRSDTGQTIGEVSLSVRPDTASYAVLVPSQVHTTP